MDEVIYIKRINKKWLNKKKKIKSFEKYIKILLKTPIIQNQQR